MRRQRARRSAGLLRSLAFLATIVGVALGVAPTSAVGASASPPVAVDARAVAAASPASGVTFGDPSATSVFGSGITFSQPVSAPGINARSIEILIERPGALGPEVHTIAQVGNIAASTFQFSLREANLHIYPNTTFSARWRVTDTSGTVSVGPETTVTYADTRFDWQTAGGKVVRVHWYKGDDAFGQRALGIGEAGIAKAEELLGVSETQPVDFYVYGDLQAFYDALGPGTRENVGGEALPGIRTLFALITPGQIDESWVGVVIPHELTHLVFDTATDNPFHFPPRWLDEGLAVYQTQGYDPSDRRLVRDAVQAGEVIPLPGIGGQFPTRRDKFALAYAESASAIDFLVRQYGRDALVKLVQSYSTGVSDDAAFQGALGVELTAFNDAWLADIGARRPIALGPVPDPVGPLPSGWSSSPAPAPSVAPVPTAPVSASGAPQPSGSAGTSAGPTTAATPPPAATPSVVLPTFAAGPTPLASAAAAPATPVVTPGQISSQPPAASTSSVGLVGLFGLVALLLAAVAAGLLVYRRRSPDLP